MKFSLALFLVTILTLAGCAGTGTAPKEAEDTGAALVLSSASFSDLPAWGNDDLKGFMAAYGKSCTRILKKAPAEKFSSDPQWGTYADWQGPCRAAQSVNANDPAAVRAFVENNFKVMKATAGGDAQGLFTGYYESTLNGSRTRGGVYQHPLLGRPSDLVMVELGDFRDELKGQRIAGRVLDGKLKPYESRAEIIAGKMPADQYRPIVWLDDPHDAFFVQVQGSGIVHLQEGGIMRVGYAAQNGHAYYAIGRELVKRGIYKKEDVSMESITQWMKNNPDKAEELMSTNPSFVFFTEMPDDGTGSGPQGGEGVKLTAGRSLAIDRSRMPYGFPVYLDVTYNDAAGTKIRRLMMAQDTGGAIRGAVRGDYFWGSGADAEKMAGPMKARGGYFFLMPKTI
jgi:membrane-bound lytic murein transglycosylase A